MFLFQNSTPFQNQETLFFVIKRKSRIIGMFVWGYRLFEVNVFLMYFQRNLD